MGYLESGRRSRRPLPETHPQDPPAGSHNKSKLSVGLELLGALLRACRVSTARAGYIFQHLSSANRRAGVLSKCSKPLFRDSQLRFKNWNRIIPILDAIPKSLNVEDLLILGQLSEAGRLGYSGVFHGVIIVQLNRGANIGHNVILCDHRPHNLQGPNRNNFTINY